MTDESRLGILSYGVGNTGSLTRAFYRAGADARLLTHPHEVSDVRHLVLPGVGSFSAAMHALEAQGWIDALVGFVASGRPMMGICLGMQLLMEEGEEGGFTQGLGLIAGKAEPLPSRQGLKLPHMGWNSIHSLADHAVLSNLRPGVDYYFAHSYVASPRDPDTVVAETMHGKLFPSVIARENVLGIQFHPEKSPPMGHKILRNFLDWLP